MTVQLRVNKAGSRDPYPNSHNIVLKPRTSHKCEEAHQQQRKQRQRFGVPSLLYHGLHFCEHAVFGCGGSACCEYSSRRSGGRHARGKDGCLLQANITEHFTEHLELL